MDEETKKRMGQIGHWFREVRGGDGGRVNYQGSEESAPRAPWPSRASPTHRHLSHHRSEEVLVLVLVLERRKLRCRRTKYISTSGHHGHPAHHPFIVISFSIDIICSSSSVLTSSSSTSHHRRNHGQELCINDQISVIITCPGQ